jgi:hypothetical protein
MVADLGNTGDDCVQGHRKMIGRFDLDRTLDLLVLVGDVAPPGMNVHFVFDVECNGGVFCGALTFMSCFPRL